MAVDSLISGLAALAHFSIGGSIWRHARNQRHPRDRWFLAGCVTLNIACGAMHVVGIWEMRPRPPWLGEALQACTALACAAVAVVLFKYLLVPRQHADLSTPRAIRDVLAAKVARADDTEHIHQLEASNRSLLENTARSAIAAEVAGLGFWSFDVATNALHWDETMFRLLGISSSPSEEPEVLSATRAQLQAYVELKRSAVDSMESSKDYEVEFSAKQPNGLVRHLKAVARIVRDPEGHALRMLGVTFDITERKHADEQFRLAIEAAPTGMLLTDLHGRIVMVNAQVESLFGHPRSELLGQPIELLVPEGYGFDMAGFRQERLTELKTPLGKVLGLRRDGSTFPVQIGLNPLVTSAGEFVLSSIVDLSQQLEIDRIRNEFVSTVSHELRTPLTSIRGSLGLLQSGVMGTLSSEAAAMVTIAYKNSGRLVRIINDILDIGTMESGKLTLQMGIVVLGELLQQCVEANAGFAEKCEVRLVLEPVAAADRVLADPDRLMQVVVNLLSNAAKFSPPGSDVLIRVRPGAATLRIEVEDSGAGIAAEFKPHVFEKFAQAGASASRRFAGTGLGLNIAQKLVQAMGGSIGFYSAADHGTIFVVELPRSDAAATSLRASQLSETAAYRLLLDSAGSRAAAAGATPRILYVEDDEDLVIVIRAALLGRVELVAAPAFWEAERLLREQEFKLAILDQALPDGDGLLLIDKIMATEWRMPIIILSAGNVPLATRSRVAAVLIKSQVSAAQVAMTILSHLSLVVP